MPPPYPFLFLFSFIFYLRKNSNKNEIKINCEELGLKKKDSTGDVLFKILVYFN